LGWAVSAATDDAILQTRAARLDDLQRLLRASRVERFAYAEALARRPADAREAIDLWRTWWRDVLLMAAGSGVEIVNAERREEIHAAAARLDVQRIHSTVEACSRALWQLEKNATPRLVVEVLLLGLPKM
jgi:DNA polymerase-3 subunit delta'